MRPNPPKEFAEPFPQARASLGRLHPFVETAWNAARNDPMGGMGIVLGGGATPAIQAAVRQKFMSQLHPALARFLERRPEVIKVLEETQFPNPNALGQTSSQQAIKSQLSPQVRTALEHGQTPTSVADRIMHIFGRVRREPVGAFQSPRADVVIRMRPNVGPTTAQHEGTHAALYLTKPTTVAGGGGIVPHVEREGMITKGMRELARRASSTIPQQSTMDEQIVEYMAQNALKRAGRMRVQ